MPETEDRSVQTKELAYKSLVKPLLEYASTVWDPTTQRERLPDWRLTNREQYALSSITTATLLVLVTCCSPWTGPQLSNGDIHQGWLCSSRLTIDWNRSNVQLQHQTIKGRQTHEETFRRITATPLYISNGQPVDHGCLRKKKEECITVLLI